MINFHSPLIEDKEWIKQKLAEKSFLTCEYTFGNIFSYNAKMNIEVADVCGYFVSKCISDNLVSYCYPVGSGEIEKAISLVTDDGIASGKPFVIYGMNSDDANELEGLFPGKYKIYENRDSFDYFYNSTDLIELKGKKYQSKRNHISYFSKNNNWTYERINTGNIEECYQMSLEWLKGNESEFKSDLENELKIIRCVFDNYSALDYVGGLLRIDGRVVAYTMGEEMTKDAFCVHFEKAFHDIRGAYPMINQQFVKNELSEYKYIDREDDVGLENLRKAKLSYHPVLLPQKFEAVIL